MAKLVALTTFDNPNDPFDDFKKWYSFDNDHGYNCCGQLAYIARTSDALTPGEYAQALEEAIDDIIYRDPVGIYRKATKEVTPEEMEEYYMESVS